MSGVLFYALLAGCGGEVRDAEAAEAVEVAPPNVLLIVVDTLRRDHLGAYGYERDTSPNLDRLAAESTRYERAVSHAPWTTPAIGALLSSQYPTTLGIQTEREVLPEPFVLLPEALVQAGYVTAAAVSHTFCSSRWGFDQGFDYFDEAGIAGGHDPEGAAPAVTRAALDFLAAEREAPFFLWLHYFDPHSDYYEHEGFDFPSDYSGPVTSGAPFKRIEALARDGALAGPNLQRVLDLYDSEIAYTDHHIGRVLDQLRATGALDDTLVIVTADHGEEFLDHRKLGHAHTLKDELIGVPLIVRYPDSAPATVTRPVGLVDVYPTVLDIAGLPPRGDLAGVSLRDVSERPVFSEVRHRRLALKSVVDGPHKLVQDQGAGNVGVFDVVADPAERSSLTRRDAGLTRRLLGLLEDWKTGLSPRHDAGTLTLSDDEQSALRALGYLEN